MYNEYFMKLALRQAVLALLQDDVPIGCVIARGNQIIGSGYNSRNASKNALAHAEIIAINQACETIGDWRLEGCTLFVTVEPCPMCAGAILQARVSKVVFGAKNKKAGCAGSIINLLNHPGFNHVVDVTEGISEEKCADLMQTYFKQLRRSKGFTQHM
ncbi:MAG: tRNA adenosine(34) deaminase TadA [Defluviitaleaceae bacterium]|nr:tRNA adenosine(34) deaminase TadA [Defluviitaleaceae bacterium]